MSKVDHSDCKSLNVLTDTLNKLIKDSANRSPKKSATKKIGKPTASNSSNKRINKSVTELTNKKLDDWLVKKGLCILPKDDKQPNKPTSKLYTLGSTKKIDSTELPTNSYKKEKSTKKKVVTESANKNVPEVPNNEVDPPKGKQQNKYKRSNSADKADSTNSPKKFFRKNEKNKSTRLVQKELCPSPTNKQTKERRTNKLPNYSSNKIKTSKKLCGSKQCDKLNLENFLKRSQPKTKKVSLTSSSKQKIVHSSLIHYRKSNTLNINDSSDICDLPTFTENKAKVTKKLTTTKKEQKELFKKYGVVLPTVDELLKDKRELERDKNVFKSINSPLSEDCLKFEPCFDSETREKENVLDCKQMTLKQLSKAFKKNFKYLNDIITGKIKNERHNRYYDKATRVLTNSVKDLTYNTSTVLFSFEQREHLLELLKETFDSDDTKTQYFFQVLLPELCLKIFMEKYGMEYNQAIKYLDKRPITEVVPS